MQVLKKYLADGKLSKKEKKFVLRYIIMNKNMEQISHITYDVYKTNLINDLISTKEYLKATNQLSGEYLERLLAIYDKVVTLKPNGNKQDIINLYYQLKK